jgi:hypothetical protein
MIYLFISLFQKKEVVLGSYQAKNKYDSKK